MHPLRALPGGRWLARARFAYELTAPRRYLFVLSHMRSYSSLLCHLLNSHDDINGYVEMHRSYRGDLDLVELALRVRSSTGERLTGRYLVDKLLHNHADLGADILNRRDVHVVFSIREPEQAVRSIIAMGLRREKLDWKSDPTKVVNHYVRRLDRLAELAAGKRKRSLFFEADHLVEATDAVLPALTSFLDLRRPLTAQYRTAGLTGARSYGDPSTYITSGTIVRERDDYGGIEIPDELMERARAAFAQTRERLAQRCEVTVTPSPAAIPVAAVSLDQPT